MYGGFRFEIRFASWFWALSYSRIFIHVLKSFVLKLSIIYTSTRAYRHTWHAFLLVIWYILISYFIYIKFVILKFSDFSQGCTTTQFQNISIIPKRNPKPIRSDYLCPLPFPSHWQPLNLFHLCAVVSSDIAHAWNHLTCLSHLPPSTKHRVGELYPCGCMCPRGCVPGYGWTTSCLSVHQFLDIWIVTNSTAVTIHVQVFVWTYFSSLGWMLGVEYKSW